MANVKVNDTTVFPVTPPAPGDLLFGTDVSNTTVDPNGKVVNFTVASIKGWTEIAAVPTTSGSELLFTGIPPGVQDVEVFFRGTGVTANSDLFCRIGSGGTLATTGYVLGTAQWLLYRTINAEANYRVWSFRRFAGNVWNLAAVEGPTSNLTQAFPGGFLPLVGDLERIRFYLSPGTFAAGNAQIRYR